jgi:hypothetical protein
VIRCSTDLTQIYQGLIIAGAIIFGYMRKIFDDQICKNMRLKMSSPGKDYLIKIYY